MNIVTTSAQLEQVASAYAQTDEYVFDVETWGEHRGNSIINDVLWIALATHGRVDVIPLGHPNGEFIELEYPLTPTGERRKAAGLSLRAGDYSKAVSKAVSKFSPPPAQLGPAEVFAALKPAFFDTDIRKIGHNIKFDLKSVTKYYGQTPEPPYADTMVASFLVDSRNNHKLGLDDCLQREFEYHMVKGVGKEVEKYGFSVVAKYAALDAKYTWLLWRALKARIGEQKLTKLFALEMDLLEPLVSMELTGALMDVAALTELRDTLTVELDNVITQIYRAAGTTFNISSNPEKLALLFGKKREGGRGLRPTHLTEGGKKKKKAGLPITITDYSVAEEALKAHIGDPVVDLLLEHSAMKKMLSTYVVPYLGGDVERTTGGKTRVHEKKALLINGRIHGEFDQIGTETGRFSSRNPNMQNIPSPKTELGRKIRNLWIAGDGFKQIVADYSQIEPRVIASLSQDPVMLNNYLTGGDIYTTIAEVMGVDRPAGKVLVLSIAYGVGPENIASQIGCTMKAAENLQADFKHRFKSIETYRRRVVVEARRQRPTPFVETLMKRRRYLPDLTSTIDGFRRRAERQAFNTKIQGSAADIIKLAMVRAHRMIPEGARMILTVHDEIVTTAPHHLADETAEAIRQAMEGISVLKVPLIADVKIVDKWGAAK